MASSASTFEHEGALTTGADIEYDDNNNNNAPNATPSTSSKKMNKSSFDLDIWLKSCDLLHLKDVFIKHKMITYNEIRATNSNFALLIGDPTVIKSNKISQLILSIQQLHTKKDKDKDNDNNHNETDSDFDTAEEQEDFANDDNITPNGGSHKTKRPKSSRSKQQQSTEYIVVSPDEHKVLTELKQSLFEINSIKLQLIESEKNYQKNKLKNENNKKKYIQNCKENINNTFWNISQIVNNRHQFLLKKIDEISLNDITNQNKYNDINDNFNNIKNEMLKHEKYINKQINEYKLLIEQTKASLVSTSYVPSTKQIDAIYLYLQYVQICCYLEPLKTMFFFICCYFM